MKIYTKTIECCGDCPLMEIRHNVPVCTMGKTSLSRWLGSLGSIPEWCPLPDEPLEASLHPDGDLEDQI